jgi:hypothetical protein
MTSIKTLVVRHPVPALLAYDCRLAEAQWVVVAAVARAKREQFSRQPLQGQLA